MSKQNTDILTQQVLHLIVLLTGNAHLRVEELAERMDMGTRNIYKRLKTLRECGYFNVEQRDGYYHIRHDSPFFSRIGEMVHISSEEAVMLQRIIAASGADTRSTLIRRLTAHLKRIAGERPVADTPMQRTMAECQAQLFKAIDQRLCAVLVGYRSVHSQTSSNRQVEPFAFLPGNEEVRCYEIATGRCKTFRLSRMEGVKLVDLYWQHQERHDRLLTDMFHYTGLQRAHVEMRLGLAAHQLLVEQCPEAELHMQQLSDRLWTLDAQLCSYQAIARFALGIMEDIEIVGDKDFIDYLRRQTAIINRKLL
ncbi:MAG: WYL domain-containing protein [Prevotella sp.]|nr:WYL domain-containing protein [Prevotella sp.]